MDKLLDLVTLKDLKGSRTKLTLLFKLALFGLVSLGIVQHDQVAKIDEFTNYVLAYFFVEHVEPKP